MPVVVCLPIPIPVLTDEDKKQKVHSQSSKTQILLFSLTTASLFGLVVLINNLYPPAHSSFVASSSAVPDIASASNIMVQTDGIPEYCRFTPMFVDSQLTYQRR